MIGVKVGILSLDRIRPLGDPERIFLQHQYGGRPRGGRRTVAQTRIISIIGKKNAGKTTLAVALASEYRAQGTAGDGDQARLPPGGR